MRDIMPDRGLVFGEWRKHGTCRGLSPEGYFALTRAAYENIAIPTMFDGAVKLPDMASRAIEGAFLDAESGARGGGTCRHMRWESAGRNSHLPDAGPWSAPAMRWTAAAAGKVGCAFRQRTEHGR